MTPEAIDYLNKRLGARMDAEVRLKDARDQLKRLIVDPQRVAGAQRMGPIHRAAAATRPVVQVPVGPDWPLAANIVPANTILKFTGVYPKTRQVFTAKAGQELTCDTQFGASIEFERPKTPGSNPNSQAYGIIIPASANGFAVSNLIVKSNNGVVWHDGAAAVAITGNRFTWGWDGSYYNKLVVWCGVGAPGLVVDHNEFVDSPNSDRNLEVWGWSNGSYSFNVFRNVNDGGHIMEPGNSFRFVGNVGTRMHRMGLEVQGGAPSDGMIIEGNQFYDWREPWNDSFGLSIMPRNMTGVVIRGNYLRSDFTGPWGQGQPGQGNRFGIAIEAEYKSGVCENNIVGGPNPWATFVACGEKDMIVRNNQWYGASLWGDIIGEPGFYGTGSARPDTSNAKFAASAMPAPSGGDGDPTMQIGYSNAALQANGGARVIVSAANLPTGTAKVKLESRASGNTSEKNTPHVAPTPVTVNVTGATADIPLTDIHPGWAIDVLVTAFNSTDGLLATAGWQRVPTTGNLPGVSTTEPWPPTADPPPPGNFHITQTITFDLINGQPKNSSSTIAATPIA
jgi:hypothetical protein